MQAKKEKWEKVHLEREDRRKRKSYNFKNVIKCLREEWLVPQFRGAEQSQDGIL